MLLLGAILSTSVASKIYKYTDEEGNVHYTDSKPSEDAKEAKIKSISVVKSQSPAPVTNRKRLAHKNKFPEQRFENFSIATPKEGANLWGTGGNVLASVNLSQELPPTYRIKFFLDGKPRGKVKSSTQLIADVERGEHTLYAQIIENQSRKVVKTTKKITFYIKQHSKK